MSGKFAFSFAATVDKVQTLADGGIKVSLLLSESAIPQAALFMECKRTELALQVDCKAKENNHAISKGTQRKSKWQATQESDMDSDTRDGRQQDGDTERWEQDSTQAPNR